MWAARVTAPRGAGAGRPPGCAVPWHGSVVHGKYMEVNMRSAIKSPILWIFPLLAPGGGAGSGGRHPLDSSRRY
eukprot:scaffold1297_cov368-Prasinococcus_capsulatus_cf.AAC.2